jgi:hypothetical protein
LWSAVLFLASGLFHAGVWVSAGLPSLEGPVSWRKPMTFGFSTGLLFLSLAWVVGLLPQDRRLARQATIFAALLVAEVALIDIQQWRGVPSHFNNATAFDAAVFTAMGTLIVSASVIIALWTRRLFRHRLATTPGYAFAARAGMLLLNVGNLIGLVIAVTEVTALKPLHGAALHAIQAMPAVVWVASRLRYPRAWRAASPSSPSVSSLEWLHRSPPS